MEDFLKDRPTLTPEEAKMIAPASSVGAKNNSGPFARIVRDDSLNLSRAATPSAPAKGAVALAKPAAASPHTSQVKTVVENGRITGLVVTCSCGKVTEIACVY